MLSKYSESFKLRTRSGKLVESKGEMFPIALQLVYRSYRKISKSLGLSLGLDHFPGLGLSLKNTNFPGLGLGLSLKNTHFLGFGLSLEYS